MLLLSFFTLLLFIHIYVYDNKRNLTFIYVNDKSRLSSFWDFFLVVKDVLRRILNVISFSNDLLWWLLSKFYYILEEENNTRMSLRIYKLIKIIYYIIYFIFCGVITRDNFFVKIRKSLNLAFKFCHFWQISLRHFIFDKCTFQLVKSNQIGPKLTVN